MSKDAIEPSEIIIDSDGTPKERVSHVAPQTRLLARMFDYGLFFLVLLLLQSILGPKYPHHLFNHIIPMEYLLFVPIEACLLRFFGVTPGKFLLRTTLKQGRRHRFDWKTSFRRSFNVWFRGIGMGIFGINFFCMFLASNKLRLMGSTSWDREENIVVSHYALTQARQGLVFFLCVCSFFAYYAS
jgi:hypothetical protein